VTEVEVKGQHLESSTLRTAAAAKKERMRHSEVDPGFRVYKPAPAEPQILDPKGALLSYSSKCKQHG
jgi:hypothetical protein